MSSSGSILSHFFGTVPSAVFSNVCLFGINLEPNMGSSEAGSARIVQFTSFMSRARSTVPTKVVDCTVGHALRHPQHGGSSDGRAKEDTPCSLCVIEGNASRALVVQLLMMAVPRADDAIEKSTPAHRRCWEVEARLRYVCGGRHPLYLDRRDYWQETLAIINDGTGKKCVRPPWSRCMLEVRQGVWLPTPPE